MNIFTNNFLKMTAIGWGCSLVGSIGVMMPMYSKSQYNGMFFKEGYVHKIDADIHKKADDFFEAIDKQKLTVPSFYDIYMFNGLRSKTYASEADYAYWKERGWLEANYYYETQMGPVKRLFASIMGQFIKSVATRMKLEAFQNKEDSAEF